MNDHDRWLGVLAVAALTLALLAAGPRAASADATAAATENEAPVPGSALPEETAEPGVADVASDATSLSKWWTDQPWRFNVNVYGWLPDAPVDIEIGNVEAALPERFGKILAGLDMAAMLEAEVHKGPIGVFASPIYYSGNDSESIQGLFESRKVRLEENVWLVDYGVSYALGPWQLGQSADSPAVVIEPFVGGRYLHDHLQVDIDPGITELDLGGNRGRVRIDPDILERQALSKRGRALLERGLIELPGRRRRLTIARGLIDLQEARKNRPQVHFDPSRSRTVTSLVDTSIHFNTPIVGFKSRWDLTKRWTVVLGGDYGGFHLGDVRSTYQGVGTIAYNFKMWNVSSKVFAGYRYLYVHYEKDPLVIRVRIRGPLFGMGFEF